MNLWGVECSCERKRESVAEKIHNRAFALQEGYAGIFSQWISGRWARERNNFPLTRWRAGVANAQINGAEGKKRCIAEFSTRIISCGSAAQPRRNRNPFTSCRAKTHAKGNYRKHGRSNRQTSGHHSCEQEFSPRAHTIQAAPTQEPAGPHRPTADRISPSEPHPALRKTRSRPGPHQPTLRKPSTPDRVRR